MFMYKIVQKFERQVQMKGGSSRINLILKRQIEAPQVCHQTSVIYCIGSSSPSITLKTNLQKRV